MISESLCPQKTSSVKTENIHGVNWVNLINRIDELHTSLYKQSILQECVNPIFESIVDSPELNEVLNLIDEMGFNLGISNNMLEFVGRNHINDIQFQFSDIDGNENSQLIAFITFLDFNCISIHKETTEIFCASLGGGFIKIANNFNLLLEFIIYILDIQLTKPNSDLIKEANLFLRSNAGFHHIDYFMNFLFE